MFASPLGIPIWSDKHLVLFLIVSTVWSFWFQNDFWMFKKIRSIPSYWYHLAYFSLPVAEHGRGYLFTWCILLCLLLCFFRFLLVADYLTFKKLKVLLSSLEFKYWNVRKFRLRQSVNSDWGRNSSALEIHCFN